MFDVLVKAFRLKTNLNDTQTYLNYSLFKNDTNLLFVTL